MMYCTDYPVCEYWWDAHFDIVDSNVACLYCEGYIIFFVYVRIVNSLNCNSRWTNYD